MAKATFAAGCFWGVEESFRQVQGVTATRVGYLGGSTDNPTYKQVCAGNTGHAEAVEVEFNPDEASYETLLALFWTLHNPTTLNRQGPDRGSQYRSAVFTHDDEQHATATKSKEAAQANFSEPIVTEIAAAPTFWIAEEYHQQYLAKQGGGSCHT
ncbi:MAG: peptide-methionine (S)-S-oxide reductase MsrA [Planctomycetales bacterium]